MTTLPVAVRTRTSTRVTPPAPTGSGGSRLQARAPSGGDSDGQPRAASRPSGCGRPIEGFVGGRPAMERRGLRRPESCLRELPLGSRPPTFHFLTSAPPPILGGEAPARRVGARSPTAALPSW